MRNTLLIRVGQEADGPCQWVPLAADGLPAGITRTGTLAEAAIEANGLRVVVLVPGMDCLLAQVKIPGRNRHKLLRAVPFALEEQLINDVEDLHFAIGPALPEGGNPVVIVSLQHMDALQAAFRTANLEVNQLIPDLLAVPCPDNGTCAVIDGDVALVRNGPWSGYAVETDNLGLLLASQQGLPDTEATEEVVVPPVRIHVPAGSAPPDLHESGLDVEVEYYNGDVLNVLATGLGSSSIDLLQGPYSRTQEWGRLWRPWRATAALLVAGVLVSNVVMRVDYYRLSKEQDVLNTRIGEIYKQAFPEAKRVVNPRVQMQQKLDQLERRQGSGGQFMVLLARSGDILRAEKEIKITGASFRAGRLDVDLTAANLQVLDKLKQTLSANGLSVEIQSATTDADRRVKSRLRIGRSDA
ncbi:MAG: type II secretion system protein GspL [Pseudomonadota bacterium]|nr:type II secretion system protein GspL [Pseudomonadota bacterium]